MNSSCQFQHSKYLRYIFESGNRTDITLIDKILVIINLHIIPATNLIHNCCYIFAVEIKITIFPSNYVIFKAYLQDFQLSLGQYALLARLENDLLTKGRYANRAFQQGSPYSGFLWIGIDIKMCTQYLYSLIDSFHCERLVFIFGNFKINLSGDLYQTLLSTE